MWSLTTIAIRLLATCPDIFTVIAVICNFHRKRLAPKRKFVLEQTRMLGDIFRNIDFRDGTSKYGDVIWMRSALFACITRFSRNREERHSRRNIQVHPPVASSAGSRGNNGPYIIHSVSRTKHHRYFVSVRIFFSFFLQPPRRRT